MSSYLSICVTSKKTYDEYSEKYDKLEETDECKWNIDYSEAFDLLEKNLYELYYCSRSYEPYRVLSDVAGFSYKYLILNRESITEALNILNEKYDYINEEIEYFRKFGGFRGHASSKRIKNAIKYLDKIADFLNVDKINNIKSLILQLEDNDDYYDIEEYNDELEELNEAKTILSALLIFRDRMDKDEVIIYRMD